MYGHAGVYEMIRRANIVCEFRLGRDLPEEVLTERFGVGCSMMRAALFRRERERAVVEVPQDGHATKPISVRDIKDMFDLHILVTSACAARAARSDSAAGQALERLRGNPDDRGRNGTFLAENRAFHFGVADLCGNARLSALEHSLVEQSEHFMLISICELQSNTVSDAIKEHNAILDAIQIHDAKTASRLAGLHAERGHALIMAHLRMSREMDQSP
jgi:DNA-binding GntR family transcriptional regulator